MFKKLLFPDLDDSLIPILEAEAVRNFQQLAAAFALIFFIIFIIPVPSGLNIGPTLLAVIEATVFSSVLFHHAGVEFPQWVVSIVLVLFMSGTVAFLVQADP